MPPPRKDPDLLFALLATETGIVSRDQFFESVQSWVTVDASLRDWLLERGWIDEEQCKALETLVRSRQGRSSSDAAAANSAARSGSGGTHKKPVGADTVSLGSSDGDEETPLQVSKPIAGGDDGRFDVQRLHAEGGLGRVYIAHDRQLDREVALKEIKERHADNLESRRRFVLEAEITGGLEHPGIVPVYGLGHYEDGRPYYTMRFIRGTSLRDAIDDFHQTHPRKEAAKWTVELRRLLNQFVDVCQAVHYAHRRGVLHRDLKPSNIMLGDYGETLVVDWGLAKALHRRESSDDDDSLPGEQTLMPRSGSDVAETMLGQAVGSPSYMSPEQARGNRDQLGPATDVYSLGATLYTILTNRAPIESDTTDGVLERVRRGDWEPPTTVANHVPAPLDAICQRAMAYEAGDRYASVAELAQDIERYLADLPVSAHRERPGERLTRIGRRHRGWVAGIAVSLILATVVSLFAAFSYHRQRLNADQARWAADLARSRADADRSVAQELAYQNEILAAQERRARELLERQRTQVEQARANLQRFENIGFYGGMLQSQPLNAAHLEKAIRDIQRQFANDTFGQARLLSTLAAKYRNAKHYEAAVQLFGLSIGAYRQALPREDPIVVSTTIELATTFAMGDEPKKAIDIAEQALESCHLMRPPNTPLTLEAMNLVVYIQMQRGEFDQAQQVADAAVRLAEATSGIDPKVIRELRNLRWTVQFARNKVPEGWQNVLASRFGQTLSQPERMKAFSNRLLQRVPLNWWEGAELALPALTDQAVEMIPKGLRTDLPDEPPADPPRDPPPSPRQQPGRNGAGSPRQPSARDRIPPQPPPSAVPDSR